MNLNLKNTTSIPENVVASFEKFFEFKLPQKYKMFLMGRNGGFTQDRLVFYFSSGTDGFVLDAFLGINGQSDTDLLNHLKTYRGRIPDKTLPIAYDSFGNLILLSVKGPDYGKVYFWDHEQETEPADYSNLTLIADSFEEFINNLKSEEEMGEV